MTTWNTMGTRPGGRDGPTDTVRKAKKRVAELEEELAALKESIGLIDKAIMEQISGGVSEQEVSTDASESFRFKACSLKDLREIKRDYQKDARGLESKIRALDPDRKCTNIIVARL